MFSLRDYQQELVENALKAWSKGARKVLLQLSTGGGKTVIFASIAREFTTRLEGVLVIAHREELILQAASKLQSVTGVEPGVIKAGYKSSDSIIQVASIQTIARRKNYPSSQLLIIDEAHHASATSYRKLIEAYPEALILGVTATPRREDGYGLRDVFDELICSVSTKELIASGYLTDYKLIAGFKYSKHKVPRQRDFTKKELAEVAQDYKPQEVLKQWRKFCDGRKTIIFAVDVAHSKAITIQLCSAGIACEHIDGETPANERKEILNRFRDGTTTVISNCAILTEGFDCPDSEAAIIARPTTSVTLWLQMIGRVLRPSPGKEYAIILDMTDNWFRLGRPCDNRQWSLDPVSCDPDTIGVRCCPSCHHVFKPMPGRVRTFESFNSQKAEFITTYETECPNCRIIFRWVLEESRTVESDGVPKIIESDGVEWQEVPSTVRPSILRPIIELKKQIFRKNKSFPDKTEAIKAWFYRHRDANLDELKYAIAIMDMGNLKNIIVSNILINMATKIKEAQDWDSVLKIISQRCQEVKKFVWDRLSVTEKNKFNQWRDKYDEELKVWLTQENINLIASYLEACDTKEMLWELWSVYNRPAIRLASKQIGGEIGEQIRAWIEKIDAMV